MGRRVEKARWLVNRLLAMSPAEVAYRVKQSGFRAWAKRQSFGQHVSTVNDRMPSILGFKNALMSFAAVPAFADVAAFEADKAINQPFQAFGKTWPYEDGDERWHRDPDSGDLWPVQAFCFDIDFRHRNGLGDAKYVWQRNKLQHLHWPAAHAALTQDKTSAAYCVAEIASWIRANPPYNGINWASGVECSYRILALGIVCSLLPEDIWERQARQDINESLEQHGYWLAHNLSLHSSANNHLIVELAGLFLIGVIAPHLPHADQWKQFAMAGLQREAVLQFAPDGGSREQSPTYGAFSLEWLALCAELARRDGTPFSKPTLQRIANAAIALSDVRDEAGNVPRIGDDDDATAFAFSGTRAQWLECVCGLAAGSILRQQTQTRPAQMMSCFGFGSVQSEKAPFRHLSASGLTVMRRQQSGGETMLVLDHGPLGYLSIAAHGHADALSIWMHRCGVPVIVDSGTYAYGADPQAREYFRGTTAHNTLTINGQNSSLISGPFSWSRRAKCAVDMVDPTNFEIKARHDGFPGNTHSRGIRMDDSGFTVTDSIATQVNVNQVDIRFLLAPDFNAQVQDGIVQVSQGARIVMTVSSTGPLQWSTEPEHGFGRKGWYSPRMGERLPAVQLHLTGRLGSGDLQVTRFEFAGI